MAAEQPADTRRVEPTPDLPPLPPSGTPARRRAIAQRRW